MLTDIEKQALVRLKAAKDANESLVLTAEEVRALLETIRRLGSEVYFLKTRERAIASNTTH